MSGRPAETSANLPQVIWLRAQIERGRKHRWLWPLFIILLVLLLIAVALHATMDQSHAADDSELLCIVVGIFFLLVSLVPRPPELRLPRVRPSRAPPISARVVVAVMRPPDLLVPLRI
jgi:hypothetical protein